MRTEAAFRRLDPVDISEVERVSSGPVFEALLQDIVAESRGAPGLSDEVGARLRLGDDPRYRRRVPLFTAAAVILLVVGLVVFAGGSGGLKGPITTSWRTARPLSAGQQGRTGHERTGTWRLVDDLLSGRWRQNPSGPPPGYLACPSASTCYAMSGRYASPDWNAPLLSESLYVSPDAGSTWSELPMPRGFAPTSPIACASTSDCVAGGTYEGQPALVSTHDGGHSFTVDPLPAGDGNLYALSCPSEAFCAGLAATSADSNGTPIDATLLSTSNGGSTFTDEPILAGASMQLLSCASSVDCTVVGRSDALSRSDVTAGVTAITTDGGHTWMPGTLPAGFGIDYLSQLSCADALHCSVTGKIASTVNNKELISDVASTSNDGLLWTSDPMPADVPQPQLSGLACPSDNECWAAGTAAIPQRIGNVSDGGSSVLLGTIDGGSTWSKVTFSVPAGAPNYDGQSYLSIGLISCPSSSVCVALGEAAQSSPSAPVYSLVVPGSERAAS